MKKLTHDVRAYLMALRMTRIDTILFMEGGDNDPIFYEVIAKRYATETGRQIDLREATELPNAALPNLGGAGGKRPLLRAATFLRNWRERQPTGTLGGKEISFCVDKDIDDILGKLEACHSVIYTPLNSVENHLVIGTDLHRAISTALSATSQTVIDELRAFKELRELATYWKDWVIYCILATRLEVSKIRTFTRPSPLNVPAYSAADPSAIASEFGVLRIRSALPQAAFDSELGNATQLVEDLIRNDRFDEVFKGKWYVDILFDLCASCPSLAPKCKKASKNALWIGIRSAFVLRERDYQYYARAIRGSGV